MSQIPTTPDGEGRTVAPRVTVRSARTVAAIVLAVMVAVTGLVACSAEEASGPPEINYGRHVCDQCHMIISEAAYASAYREVGGSTFVFDDIGDMLAHLSTNEDAADASAWVHDYHSGEWVDAPEASFVHSPQIQTPMGGGIVAFADPSDADGFAGEHDGDVLGWSDLLADLEGFATKEGHS